MTSKIEQGDFSDKSGWVRISLHPTMTENEVNFIAECLEKIVLEEYDKHYKDYNYNPVNNEFTHKNDVAMKINIRDTFKS